MKSSTIIRVFQSLDPSKLKAFAQYVSQTLRPRSKAAMVWSVILQHLTQDSVAQLDFLLKKVNNKINASNSELKNILSKLMGLYDDYLVQSYLQRAAGMKMLLAYEEAMADGHTVYLKYRRKKIASTLQSRKDYSSLTHHNYLRYQTLTNNYEINRDNQVNTEKLYEKHQQLQLYTLIETLKIHCSLFDAVAKFRDKISGSLSEKIEQLPDILSLDLAAYQDDDLVTIFYHLLSLTRNQDDISFFHLYDKVDFILTNISAQENKSVIVQLQNFLLDGIQKNREGFDNLYIKLILQLVEHERYQPSEWELKNFVTILCRSHLIQSAEQFLRVKLTGLPKERQDYIFNYNHAVISFYQGAYQNAIFHLNRADQTHPAYFSGARFIQTISLYYLDDLDGALSLLKSFTNYINHNRQLTTEKREGTLAFSRIFQKIINVKQEEGYQTSKKLSARYRKILTELRRDRNVLSGDLLIRIIQKELR